MGFTQICSGLGMGGYANQISNLRASSHPEALRYLGVDHDAGDHSEAEQGDHSEVWELPSGEFRPFHVWRLKYNLGCYALWRTEVTTIFDHFSA